MDKQSVLDSGSEEDSPSSSPEAGRNRREEGRGRREEGRREEGRNRRTSSVGGRERGQGGRGWRSISRLGGREEREKREKIERENQLLLRKILDCHHGVDR